MSVVSTHPLVSVVITTRNRNELLDRAVKSVLSQSYSPLELIIVDDGSTDGTREYCCALQKINPNVQYVCVPEDESGNSNHARNIGIDSANGEWIAFLDDDDAWMPEKIRKQMEFIQNNSGVQAVSCRFVLKYVSGNHEYTEYKRHPDVIDRSHLGFFVNPWLGHTSDIIASKEALINVGKFDEEMPAMQECELSYRICLNYSVGIIDEVLSEYYIYLDNNIQISKSYEKIDKAKSIIDRKYADELSQLTDEQKEMREFCMSKARATRCYACGNRKEFRKTIRPILQRLGLLYSISYWTSYIIPYKQAVIIKVLVRNFLYKFKDRLR